MKIILNILWWGGSLIGAIRHKGMIPWDDDIDIILYREEYDKLINILKEKKHEKFILMEHSVNDTYFVPYAKIVDISTTLYEENTKKIKNYGVFLDIFALDNLPNNERLIKKQYRTLNRLRICIIYWRRTKIEKNGKIYKRLFKNIVKLYSEIVGIERIYKKYQKTTTKYNNDKTCKYVMSNWPTYSREQETHLKEDFEKNIECEFDGLIVKIPEKYDSILTRTFGDYMTPPPPEKRVGIHNVIAYRKEKEEQKEIFIIGSKGIPARYGGFETFVDKLTEYKQNPKIKYNVACIGEKGKEFTYNNARCFCIKVPNIGPAKAVYYDIKALKECIKYIKKNRINNSIVYILACRIGPFIKHYKKQLNKFNCELYINPDGHEWKRAKWNALIKKYWKLSEKLMVKNADLLICDSINIEKYIQKDYAKYKPKTTFIAYGANIIENDAESDEKLKNWYLEKELHPNDYYLVVGRFVPENNFETMITEFMKSKTKKDLVLITNVEKNKFFEKLRQKTKFDKDKRIKFVGTVYDEKLLSEIRKNAYAYIHGHEVGGTNPSLLEALATTKLNLLLDVGFNKEVGENGAIYWNKTNENLAQKINEVDKYSQEKIEEYSRKSKGKNKKQL